MRMVTAPGARWYGAMYLLEAHRGGGEPLAALPPSAILLQIGVSGEKFTRYVLPAKSRFKWRAEMLCRTRKSELRVPAVFEAVHGGACGGELFGQARRVWADRFLELQHDG